jgi:hypothetical protein
MVIPGFFNQWRYGNIKRIVGGTFAILGSK